MSMYGAVDIPMASDQPPAQGNVTPPQSSLGHEYGTMGVGDDISAAPSTTDENKSLIPPDTNSTSTNRTLMNFLRSMIGPGCLALPVAVKKSGLWGGMILIIGLGLLNLHCMSLLVSAAQYLCKKSGKSDLDYGHLAKKSVDFGPEQYRTHSKKALFVYSTGWAKKNGTTLTSYVTNAVIVILQLGICSVQFVFMASHVAEVVNDFVSTADVSVAACMAVIAIPMVLFNFIRSINIMSLFSTVANLLMLVVFGVIFYAVLASPRVEGPRLAFTNPLNTSMAVGAILYAFEGQAVILPLENRMAYPDEMLGYTGVLFTGMGIVIALYAATGFFGYLTYGEQVQASITLSLPSTPIYDATKLLLVVAVFVGYGLQLYVVIAMLWPPIKRKMLAGRENLHLPLEFVFRSALVLFTFLVAIVVPNLDAIISLVGITSGLILAFVFPPLLETYTFWQLWTDTCSRRHRAMRLTKNMLLIAVGLFGLVFGLYSTALDIAASYGV